ncbi:uncharacterized protein M421DRAFT_115929 [Didymella exigua CBS 183.55]|uniref:Uncharacterized protein n=1 Tax=Didymella exigua CBS 183.55 TaxID=1150837 RepID=A0A6A5S0M0_9PLEO|nr:uncharacterized protein M421DRAFT_115929 [Didymella exigua CBS 183.55]KAF1934221.1 hypothetical protein M421DRAFT_115929 [Didymella exigua CBS 183.55]
MSRHPSPPQPSCIVEHLEHTRAAHRRACLWDELRQFQLSCLTFELHMISVCASKAAHLAALRRSTPLFTAFLPLPTFTLSCVGPGGSSDAVCSGTAR